MDRPMNRLRQFIRTIGAAEVRRLIEAHDPEIGHIGCVLSEFGCQQPDGPLSGLASSFLLSLSRWRWSRS